MLYDVILSNKFNNTINNVGTDKEEEEEEAEEATELEILTDIILTASKSSRSKKDTKEMENYFSGLFSALCDNFNPLLFAQHLGRLHGIPMNSVCAEQRSSEPLKTRRIWGNILPIKCNDYYFDETLLLLRNYFALRGGNEYKIRDDELNETNEKLEEKWKLANGIVDADAAASSNTISYNQNVEIQCTDQIVSLLTKDEVKELIQSIKDYKSALEENHTIGSKKKILRKIFTKCGRNATLIWPTLVELIPFINTNRLYLKKVSHDKYSSKTFSLNLSPAFNKDSWDTISHNKSPKHPGELFMFG